MAATQFCSAQSGTERCVCVGDDGTVQKKGILWCIPYHFGGVLVGC